MRRRWGAGVIALVAAVLVLTPGSGQAGSVGCPGATDVPAGDADRAAAARAMLCLVNAQRTARGLRALRLSHRLSRAARAHDVDMVAHAYFGHDGSGGDTLQTRVQRSGYGRSRGIVSVGEALAWGQLASPAMLMDALMGSGEHRRILLGRRARNIGIAVELGAPLPDVPPPATTVVLDIGA